jgi:hypothetical protein
MGAAAEGFRVPDLREPPVADCDRRDDRMRRIHREDATVYECEIPRASALRRIRPRGLPLYRPACCTCRRSRQHALNELAAQESTLPTINRCHGILPVWPRRIRPSLRPRYSLRPQRENHQCPPFTAHSASPITVSRPPSSRSRPAVKRALSTGYRHPRESGGPGQMVRYWSHWISRFRGNDE